MDKNKIRHDLGVAYAQARMIDALAKNFFPNKNRNMKQELTLHTRCLNGTAGVQTQTDSN